MKQRGFTVIAHRGARAQAPENTPMAFERAIELGAPWIELDVQLHHGALLVFHDRTLERCTNGQGLLSDHPIEYLRGLDAGQNQRIPFLHEVLERVHRRARINIELKTGGDTAAAVAEVLGVFLQRGWQPEEFLVSSFLLPQLREFRQRLPSVPVGVLLTGVPLDLAACASALGASVLSVDLDFIDAALIEDARRRGLKVFVFTVNEQGDIARMKELRVDGIFTDYPERALVELSS